MKQWVKNNRLRIITTLSGAAAGFAYWYFIGCASGTCPITSSPYISTLWGAAIGFLIAPGKCCIKKENSNCEIQNRNNQN